MSEARGFGLDLGKCVGCGACVLACRIENQLPAELAWRRVLTLNSERHRGGPTFHFSVACHHCADPPCRNACPTAALEKREDGVVLLHTERCIGCRYCEMACPFGAPAFDANSGVMTKCHLCHHRLDEGLKPACVGACPTGALSYEEDIGAVPAPAVPGFVDPGDAGPSIRFTLPGGTLRKEKLEGLWAALLGREEAHDES